MTHQPLVDRHYAEINRNDFSDAAELFSPDVVTDVPDAGRLAGIEPFIAYGRAFLRAFPDGRIHGDRYVESADRIVVEGRFTGTNTGPLQTPAGELPPTGRAMVAVRRRLPRRRRQDRRAPGLLRHPRAPGPARSHARARIDLNARDSQRR